MLPLPIMNVYGNTAPKGRRIVDFLLDTSASPTMIMLLENGELWGISSNGSYLGLGDTSKHYGGPYLSTTNVKKCFSSSGGTVVITSDNKFLYTGRTQPYDGSTTTLYNTWQDKTSFYSTIFDVSNIQKVCLNSNTMLIHLTDGTVYALGTNINGLFGIGNTTPSYTPILVNSQVQDIWLTGSNSIYRTGRYFFAVGTNTYYQMGTTSTGPFYSWQRIFSTASNDSNFTINALRVSDTHFILYSTGKQFYAQGRNYSGAWGIGSVNIDVNVASYAGNLAFVPHPNLSSFYGFNNQAYWTNLIIDTNGVLYIAGTVNGGGSPTTYSYTFSTAYTPGVGNASGYICGTGTRMYAICDISSDNFVWARGSSSTTSEGYGFTPGSTPLPEAWTHITDFTFNVE